MNKIITQFRKLFGVDVKTRVAGVDVIRLPIFNDKSQIVVAVFDAGVKYPLHSHEQDEKIFIVSGKGRVTIEDRDLSYVAGDTFLIKKDEIHAYNILTKTVLISVQDVAIKY